MGCNCGGSKQVKAQEVAARRREVSRARPAQGPKSPGYYSGPKPAAPKAPAQ